MLNDSASMIQDHTRMVDDTIERLRRMTAAGGVPCLTHERSDARTIEAVIRRAVEEQNFTFTSRDLSGLEAFLVAENGYRRIVTARDLSPEERVYLYFHLLGHMACRHVDESRYSLQCELRDLRKLTPRQQFAEFAADMSAHDLILRVLAAEGAAGCRNAIMERVLHDALTRTNRHSTGTVRVIHVAASLLYRRLPRARTARHTTAGERSVEYLYWSIVRMSWLAERLRVRLSGPGSPPPTIPILPGIRRSSKAPSQSSASTRFRARLCLHAHPVWPKGIAHFVGKVLGTGRSRIESRFQNMDGSA